MEQRWSDENKNQSLKEIPRTRGNKECPIKGPFIFMGWGVGGGGVGGIWKAAPVEYDDSPWFLVGCLH